MQNSPDRPPIQQFKTIVQLTAIIALVIVTYLDLITAESVNAGVYGTLFAAIVGAELYSQIRRP